MEIKFGKLDGVRVNKDLDNRKHGPHYDVLTRLEVPGMGGPISGTEQTRVDASGRIIGGTTNIGKCKLGW